MAAGPADVSVVVCTRNRPAHLRAALAAIHATTPEATEVVVVDSGSDTDETRTIALEAGAGYVRSVKGLSIARNAGLAATGRPIVLFTDDDCRPAPGWVERAAIHFADASVGAVTGDMIDHTAEVPAHAAPVQRFTRVLDGIDAGHGAVMAFRRELVLRLGGFDDLLGAGQRFAGAEDLDMFVRVLRAGSVVVHDPLCVVTHANTRLGADYLALHHGYGLGLGAFTGKFLRIDRRPGLAMGVRFAGRAVSRIVRGAVRGADVAHDRALLRGLAAGLVGSARIPVVGERFLPRSSALPVPVARRRDGDERTDASGETPRRTSVELLRILDETHIANSLQYEAMHIGAIMILDGAAVSTPDGLLDREKLLAAVGRGVARVPEFSLRLVDSPFGITAPAWVPADGDDIRDHVTFHDEAVPFRGGALRSMTDPHDGVLSRERPLWDFAFTRLEGGDVAWGLRIHHVVGDGGWGFETMTRLTDAAAGDWAAPPATPRTRAPRTAWAIPVTALRTWLREQPSWRAGWHEYWRKPFVKRVMRLGGRNIRPAKELLIRRRGLRAVYVPPTTHAVFAIDASGASRRAAKLRGSLNDLLVAGAMGAVDADLRGIDVNVPVSQRARVGRAVRNHVRMTTVHGVPGADLAERVASVRAHVSAFASGDEVPDAPRGRAIGYATSMPWARERRWFAGAAVKSLVILPVNDRRDELSVFAAMYAGELVVTLTGRAELDLERSAARLREAMTGAAA